VLICHQALTLRGGGCGEMPKQELLAHDCGGQPDTGLHSWIQVGVLRSQPSLPDFLLHSDLLPRGSWSRVLLMVALIARPARVMLAVYRISLQGASFSLPGAVAKW
jgi:hypothetical protein